MPHRPFRTLACLAVLLTGTARAQLVQTDEFDYWEDQSTHSFSASGITYQGAYTCSTDKTLRCGDCGNGTGAASVVLKVNTGCDTVLLTFLVGWAGGNTKVTVDGVQPGTIGGGGCAFDSVMLVNASALTADSAVTVVVRDTILGCSGDIQLARVKAYASPAQSSTGTVQTDAPAHALSVLPNPAHGTFLLAVPDHNEVAHVFLRDIRGNVVFEDFLPPHTDRLPVNAGMFAHGMYFLSVVLDGNMLNEKVVLQNR